jgi:hypothetical protein
MALPLTAPMPPNLDLTGGYTVRVTAVDPVSGAVVSGVVVSGVAIQATSKGTPIADLTPGPLLVPSSSIV